MLIRHRSGRRPLAIERHAIEAATDQRDGLGDAVQRDEAAKSRSLGLAQKHLIQTAKPGAQLRERMAFADFENGVLDGLGRRVRRQRGQRGGEILQRFAFERLGFAELFLDPDEVVVIGDRVLDEAGKQRFVLGRGGRDYSGG